jgi:hypothetical protein
MWRHEWLINFSLTNGDGCNSHTRLKEKEINKISVIRHYYSIKFSNYSFIFLVAAVKRKKHKRERNNNHI